MLKEYCDKCGAEIVRGEGRQRYEIWIQLRNIGKYGDDEIAKIVLCPKCFEKLDIRKAVADKGCSDKRKEPEAVEKLVNAIKELVRDSVLEELQ